MKVSELLNIKVRITYIFMWLIILCNIYLFHVDTQYFFPDVCLNLQFSEGEEIQYFEFIPTLITSCKLLLLTTEVNRACI